jgi:hypothetical protein
MIGIPIDLMPEFPGEASMVLLTESAAADPTIVDKIKKQLLGGKSVAITSGLLRGLQGKGIEDIAEIRHADRKAILKGFPGRTPIPSDLRIAALVSCLLRQVSRKWRGVNDPSPQYFPSGTYQLIAYKC